MASLVGHGGKAAGGARHAAPGAQAACDRSSGGFQLHRIFCHSEDTKILDALMLHLKDTETLPANLKDLLAARAEQNHRYVSKHLHALIKSRTKARAEVTQVRAEMTAFDNAWSAYSSHLLKLLQQQLQQRQETMDKLQSGGFQSPGESKPKQ